MALRRWRSPTAWVIGAMLDRRCGLLSRYYVTTGYIMASEVGALDIPPEHVVIKERVRPGRWDAVDTEQGRIISDDEIKDALARERPYGEWLSRHLIHIDQPARFVPEPDHDGAAQQARRRGLEDRPEPMARTGDEPLGSMGTDTPLAVLSDCPRLLFDYVKQLFAQVTNPPLDAIREALVTSMASTHRTRSGIFFAPNPRAAARSSSTTRLSTTSSWPDSATSRWMDSGRAR